jgi:hypothetical protein
MSRKPLAICAWACGSLDNLVKRKQWLPSVLQKTSDVSQTSDVGGIIVKATVRSPLRNKFPIFFRFFTSFRMTNFCHSRENGNLPVRATGRSPLRNIFPIFFRFFTSFRMTICFFWNSQSGMIDLPQCQRRSQFTLIFYKYYINNFYLIRFLIKFKKR